MEGTTLNVFTSTMQNFIEKNIYGEIVFIR